MALTWEPVEVIWPDEEEPTWAVRRGNHMHPIGFNTRIEAVRAAERLNRKDADA